MTEIKKGYKKTEIGVIPEGWELKYVKNISTIITGTKNTQDKIENGKYPFYVRSQTVQKINSYSFDGEAVLTAGDGVGVGKIFHYLNEKFDYHQRVYNIHNFNKNISGKYFFEYFKNKFYLRVSKMSAKNSVDSVRFDMIAKMIIPIPPLKEQEKIADILSTADEKIDSIEQQIQKAQTLKKGLLQKLLSEGIGHREFKDSELGKIPESWEVVKLDNMSIVITKGTTPTTLGFNYQNSGINFIKVESIGKNGNFIIDKFAYISEEANNSLQRSIIKEDDLLLSIAGALGRVALVNKNIVPANTNQALSIIRLKDEYIKKYVYFYLNSSQIQNHIDKINVQNAQANLSLQNIKNFKIALPPLKEQKQIADILSTADEKLEVLRAKKEKYETLKKGLLQKLLSGEVRV